MKVAEVFADFVAEESIRHVFGLPGGETLQVMEALHQRGIQFVLSKHETLASFMAESYGLHTGKPGILLTTKGPGVTNAITGITNAYLDRSPLLAVTGGFSDGPSQVMSHQELNLGAMLSPATKWSTSVPRRFARRTLRKAMRLALSGVPGPVHLVLPTEISESEAEAPMAWEEGKTTQPLSRAPSGGNLPDPALIAECAAWLAAAERPVLLVGLGGLRGKGQANLAALLDQLPMPVMSTFKSKGVLDEEHPMAVGVYGLQTKAMQTHWELVRGADLVLTLGYDVVESMPPWERVWDSSRRIVHIDWHASPEASYSADLELVGDPWAILTALQSHLTQGGTRSRWSTDEVQRLRRQALDSIDIDPASNAGISPNRAITELRRCSPKETILTTDVGSHKVSAAHFWVAHKPGEFMMSNGHSTMGYGLPAAIGAKLAKPDQPVACVMGDGGFYMVLGELETVRRLGLGIVMVVFNDGQLNRIKVKQESKGFAATGVKFGFPDAAMLAQSFGIEGCTVTHLDQLGDAVSRAFATNQPALIVVQIDPAVYGKML